MSLKVFSPALLFEKQPIAKGKDKSSIQCMEWCCKNFYIGGKDSVIQLLALPSASTGDSPRAREVRKRQMGRSGPITQLKAIPVLNHLLVLWDGSVSVLNMFSLEPVPALKKIQNVSLFHLSKSTALTPPIYAELYTASTKRRTVSIHKVCVDRWECVRQVSLPQDPVALAVDATCLCVATNDRYILHDYQSGSTLDLFQHNLSKQNVIANKAGDGEFLLNGPGSLGMFVMKNGISQRPPVQWPEGALDAVVHFPYVLALQSQAVHIYSMLDQKLKQTIPLQSTRGLLSTTESVYIVAEREIHCLSPVPLEDQIHTLVGYERVDEALVLLNGVKALLPEDTYKDLHKNITCTSGLIKFYQECFSEAKELFIKGDLDPREIISLYPEMSQICEDFKSQLPPVSNAKNLYTLSEKDRPVFQQYQNFLCNFLREVRDTVLGHSYSQDIDTALLRLYLEQEESENLNRLVSSPNDCVLYKCAPDLELHKRFYSLGLLYQSHGQHFNAIQTWVNIVDEQYDDSSCSDVYQHIVNTLCQLKDSDIIWKFADWALERNQETGIEIFTKRHPEDQDTFAAEDVLTFLTKVPLALILYLEFLVYELHSKVEKHHALLATTYVTQILQEPQRGDDDDSTGKGIRNKLQQLLWHSSFSSTDDVHEKIMSTSLHMEKAILLGRAGEHGKALQILVHKEKDQQAAEDYCWRTSAGQDREFTQMMFLSLLQIYLESGRLLSAAVDLLNNNAVAFDLVSVLQVLPGSWSLQLVTRFLSEALRGTVHQRRMRGVEMGLVKVEHLRHKHAWTEASNRMIRVDKGCVCQSCRRLLTAPEFLCSPAGELTHTHCVGGDSCARS